MKRILLIGILSVLAVNVVFTQRQTFFVNPQLTDPQIDLALASHYLARNSGAPQRGQLMVFFPGTGGTPFNYRSFTNVAADIGFHALGLTYVNDQAVNEICGPTANLDCYGNVRLEIVDGTDRSALVTVNRQNSIENRLIKLLLHMQQTDAAGNWSQYLEANNQIRWDRIVVAGHSQGGGHAGIIGKNKRVVRVIMFAAMDFSGIRNSPANWILAPGVTPNADFYGFSHQQDESVNYTTLSTRIWPAYGMDAFGAPVNVDTAAPPYGNTHSLTSNFADIPSGSNYHGAIAVDGRFPVDENGVSIYEPVWRYLLNTNAPLSLTMIQFLRVGQSVTRPVVGSTTKRYQISVQGSGFDGGSSVWVNGTQVETEFVNAGELRAKLPAGKFGSVGNSNVQVRGQSGAVSNTLTY